LQKLLHSEDWRGVKPQIIQLHEEIQMRKEIVLAVALALGSTFAVAADEPCKGADGKAVSEDVIKKFDKDGKPGLSATECLEATKAPGGAAGPKGEDKPGAAGDKPPAPPAGAPR
jgi:hypothetical protein